MFTKQTLERWYLILASVLILFPMVFGGDKASSMRKLTVGDPAPDFSAIDMKGKRIALSELRGKIVLLDFWLTYCRPCIKHFPELKRLQEEYSEDLVIIGISADKSKNRLSQVIKEKQINWIQIADQIDNKGKLFINYKVGPIPHYFLIDQNGILVDESLGTIPLERIQTYIEK